MHWETNRSASTFSSAPTRFFPIVIVGVCWKSGGGRRHLVVDFPSRNISAINYLSVEDPCWRDKGIT